MMKLTAKKLLHRDITRILQVFFSNRGGGGSADPFVAILGTVKPRGTEIKVDVFVLDITVKIVIRQVPNKMEFVFEFDLTNDRPWYVYQHMAWTAAVLGVALGLERELDFDDGQRQWREEAIRLTNRLYTLASERAAE